MKNNIKLFFDPFSKSYFYTGSELCKNCSNELNKVAIIQTSFSKKKSLISFYCFHCINKIRNLTIYNELKTVFIVDFPPKTAYPIFFNRPSLIQGKTIFEVADITNDDAIIKDRTKLSGRKGSSWVGSQIGDSAKVEEINFKNNQLLTSGLKSNDALNLILESKPLLDKPQELSINCAGCSKPLSIFTKNPKLEYRCDDCKKQMFFDNAEKLGIEHLKIKKKQLEANT